MGVKKKLGMGMASAVLGLSLIGGGTLAYFSDTETTANSFAAGTLDLSIDPTEIINVDNIKPGDWMTRNFELHNDGTIDISSVGIKTNYTVNDPNVDNTEDFGQHIKVNFLYNHDKGFNGFFLPDEDVIYQTTLADLKNMEPDAVKNEIFNPWFDEIDGLEAGDADTLTVQFEFVENGQDQNMFQGDSLDLEWKFIADQGEGEAK